MVLVEVLVADIIAINHFINQVFQCVILPIAYEEATTGLIIRIWFSIDWQKIEAGCCRHVLSFYVLIACIKLWLYVVLVKL